MDRFIIKCGRQPEFTVAELIAKVDDIQFIKRQKDYLLVTTNQELNQKFLDSCGSIPEIYKLLGQVSQPSEFIEVIEPKTGTFALSWLPKRSIKDNQKREHLKMLKKHFKSKVEGKVRYLNKGINNVKAAYLLDQGILRGKISNYAIMTWEQNYLVLETVALQNINSYSKRDYKKPARDMQRGMFPPKLAQILISLSTQDHGQPHIHDPFCGVGTVLMEASLAGFPSSGSDIDEYAIKDSNKNLTWLNTQFPYNNKNWTVWPDDATKLESKQANWKRISSIATEGYLGKIMNKPIDPSNPPGHIPELYQIYNQFLAQLATRIKKGTTVVFCLPAYKTTAKSLYFCENIVENLESLGYIRPALIPETLSKQLDLKLTERNSLVYMRPDQNVGREIIKVIKN